MRFSFFVKFLGGVRYVFRDVLASLGASISHGVRFLCWHELKLNIMPMFDELTVQCAVHGKCLLAGVLLFFKLAVCTQSVTTKIQANRYQIEISMAYA